MKPLCRLTLICTVLALLSGPCALAAPLKKAAPATPAAGKAVEEEKEGAVLGVAIARADGTWLGLRVVENRFLLTAYNKKKNPTPIGFASASARWTPTNRTGVMFAAFSPGSDPASLQGNKVVNPPHIFKVFLSLLDAEGKVVENYVVDYRD